MRAEELQIGDLLRVNRDGLCIKKGTVVTVQGIDGNNNFPEKRLYGVADCRPLDASQFQGGIWLDYLDPIPLAPEILEKNGFHETESNKYFPTPRWVFIQDGSRDGVIIEITFYQKPVNGVNVLTKVHTQSSKDSGVNKLHSCDIETIHELQHALRLCGIDKEIQI